MSKTVSRRDFLRAAAAGTVGAAALGVMGTALATEAPGGGMPEGGPGGGPMMFNSAGYDPAEYPDPASWRVAPDPIPDSQIKEEHTADVIIVGHGHFGINCAKYICQHSDKSVILIEKQDPDVFAPLGNEWTQLNSEFGFTHAGFDAIDPVEFQQNWMLAAGNTCNPELIMNYAQYSGAATDAFLEDLTEEDIATITYNYNNSKDKMLHELGGLKFYFSCVSPYGACNQSKMHTYNRQACEALGAQFFFNMKGVQLVTDPEGAVVGVIGQDQSDDSYVKYNANTCVVLATGGFGANGNMCLDLLPDLRDMLVGDEMISAMRDYDGSGIQMGYWAGGKIQPGAIATMNGKHKSPGNPQMVWLNKSGRRFTNEFYPILEQRGIPAAMQPRDTFYLVYDANYPDNMVNVLPQHGATEPTEAAIQSAREAIEAAYAAGPEGNGGTYAADTLEEVFTYAGMSDEVKAAALKQIEEYNAYCEAGRDEQFGRFKEVLFPVLTPPFVCRVTSITMGSMMCTNGGLLTDGNGQVLDSGYEPIKGLFAGGNCGGARFGRDYFTPGPGVSIGICLTLGYCTGKYIAENL